MYIIIDTETTGLPKSWRAPVTDLGNWPRLVQIAWARFDPINQHLETKSFVVKPEGFTIPKEARKVHGISTAIAMTEGKPLLSVLKTLVEALKDAKIMIAHNLAFDENVIGAEFLRKGLDLPFHGMKRICTMIETTRYCRLPGPHGYKWPTLGELHGVLFGKNFEESHHAEVDVAVCAKCFFELKHRQIISI